jgi:hypothetical protein
LDVLDLLVQALDRVALHLVRLRSQLLEDIFEPLGLLLCFLLVLLQSLLKLLVLDRPLRLLQHRCDQLLGAMDV